MDVTVKHHSLSKFYSGWFFKNTIKSNWNNKKLIFVIWVLTVSPKNVFFCLFVCLFVCCLFVVCLFVCCLLLGLLRLNKFPVHILPSPPLTFWFHPDFTFLHLISLKSSVHTKFNNFCSTFLIKLLFVLLKLFFQVDKSYLENCCSCFIICYCTVSYTHLTLPTILLV